MICEPHVIQFVKYTLRFRNYERYAMGYRLVHPYSQTSVRC